MDAAHTTHTGHPRPTHANGAEGGGRFSVHKIKAVSRPKVLFPMVVSDTP
jgi:hypothetical protein